MIRRIRLMADYQYFPLWEMDDVGDIDPNELPLSEETITRLLKWQKIYDETMNWDAPSMSNFASKEDLIDFEIEGINLWNELQKELGEDYQIYYFSQLEGRLLSESNLLDKISSDITITKRLMSIAI